MFSKLNRIKTLVKKIPSLDYELKKNKGMVMFAGSKEFCEVGNVIIKIRKILDEDMSVKDALLETVSFVENTGQNAKLDVVESCGRYLRESIEALEECSRCNKLFDPPHEGYSGYCSPCIEETYVELAHALELRDKKEEST